VEFTVYGEAVQRAMGLCRAAHAGHAIFSPAAYQRVSTMLDAEAVNISLGAGSQTAVYTAKGLKM
jgi:class 3 adenylate cyclase